MGAVGAVVVVEQMIMVLLQLLVILEVAAIEAMVPLLGDGGHEFPNYL